MSFNNYSAMISTNKITSPITQSGRVVVNAMKDGFSIMKRQRNAARTDDVMDDANYHVLVHELAFIDRDRKFENRMGQDSRVPIITSVNGMDSLAYIQFVGVVGSRALHDSRNNTLNEEDCTVQIGGLCTVMNLSPLTIEVGDWLTWTSSQPASRVQGVQKTKKTLTVIRADVEDSAIIARALSRSMPGQPVDILMRQ